MVDYDFSSYNYVDNTGFWGAPQQITWHIDRFRDKHEEMMSAQTMMIEVKFDALIKGLKDIFTGKQEGTQNNESYYDMVQRENSETQAAMTAHTSMMKDEMDETEDAINNNTTRLFGAISSNTQSTASAIAGQTSEIKNSTLKTNVQNWPDWNH